MNEGLYQIPNGRTTARNTQDCFICGEPARDHDNPFNPELDHDTSLATDDTFTF